MKIQEIRQKSRGDLVKELDKQRKKLQRLLFKSATGEIGNSGEIKATKKTIARILTVINEEKQ